MPFLRRDFRSKSPPSAADLLKYLADPANDLGGRNSVAMDLSAFNEPEVEAALLKITLDRTEDEMIIDSAGDSLREIWERKGTAPHHVEFMHPSARKFFVSRA